MVDRLGWNTFGYNHADDTPFPFPLLQDRSTARNNDDIPPVLEDDIALLPRFMPGFDLERKSWGLFDVDEVEPIKFNENAWKHIVLDESSKELWVHSTLARRPWQMRNKRVWLYSCMDHQGPVKRRRLKLSRNILNAHCTPSRYVPFRWT
ncbi:hypothetical protein BDR04DRAFT_294879 [Suillus decipiens]|nr:hypothetical protein BDR04DRAFT_294879 [Suillus decipiens]